MNQQQFNSLYDQASTIVKRIKQKNDFITRGSVGSEARLVEEINSDKEFLNRDVHRLNSIIQQMEQNYVDPFTAKKLDNLKKEAKKQINRNQFLIKELIKNTFETLSHGNGGSLASSGNHTYQIEMQQQQQKRAPAPHTPHSDQKHLMLVHQGTPLQLQLQNQKLRILQQFQKTIVQVHQIMKQTQVLIHDQGQNLNLISEQVQQTHQNVVSANQNMSQASHHQKKHLKWCIIVFVVLLVVAGVVVAVLLAKK